MGLPDLPQPPEDPDRFPGWPAWCAPLGFFTALILGIVIGGIVIFVVVLASGAEARLDEEDPTLTIVATLIQDVLFVLVAIGLAWITTRPRAWHFGLRAAPAWSAIGWTALAFATFLAFSVAYQTIFGEPPEQSTLDDLGARKGTFGMVLAGILVIVIAPFVEEFFFRGFFYGSLRTSLPIWAAAAITAVIFGAIHLPSGPESVPLLIGLGMVFCLLYERTGTLYSSIALHAGVNSLAFGVGADAVVAAGLGATMLVACLALPLTNRGRLSPLPSARVTTA